MKARKNRKEKIRKMDNCVKSWHEQTPGRIMCERCGGFLVPTGKEMIS